MKTICIPKLEDEQFFELNIYIGKSVVFGTSKMIYLKNQTVCNVAIPKDTIMKIPAKDCFINNIQSIATVKGKHINKILKTIYIQAL